MPPADVLDATIRAALVRALTMGNAAQLGNGRADVGSVLDEYFLNVETREAAFRCAISLCEEDHHKRRSVAALLLTFVVGFTPSDATLSKICDLCSRLRNATDSACPFDALLTVTETLKLRSPSGGLDGGSAKAATPFDLYRGLPDGGRVVPHYLQQAPMQPVVRERNRRVVGIPQHSAKECADVAEAKNAALVLGHSRRLTFTLARCRDYIDQTPVQFTEPLLDQQLRILGSYFDVYRSNANVLRATSFLIKIWCDAYVSKLPLVSSTDPLQMASSLRMVTVSFAPVLLQLMDSEYFCVRNHVYDVVLTLSMHLQLIDTQLYVSWLPAALRIELRWLLDLLVTRQCNAEHPDERLMLAALKCVLMVLPRSDLRHLEHRSLKSFLLLHGLAHTHPHIYLLLTEALAVRLVRPHAGRWEGALEGSSASVLCISEAELNSYGWTVTEVLQLYCSCPTAASRLHLFCVVCSLAAHRVSAASAPATAGGKAGPALAEHPPELLAKAIHMLSELNVHWHLHTLLLYQSHRTARELPSQLGVDLGMKATREVKSLAVALVQHITLMLERFHTLPVAMRRGLAAIAAAGDDLPGSQRSPALPSTTSHFDTLRSFGAECCEGIPSLLTDDTCASQRHTAKTLMFQAVRMLKVLADAHSSCLAQLIKAVAASPVPKVRSAMPDVIGGLWALARTQQAQAVGPLQLALKVYLQHETSVSSLLKLFSYLLEGMTLDGTLSPQHDGDISQLVMAGHKVPLQSSVEVLGVQTIWGLYWGIRRSTLAAACRARVVLLSVLSALSTSSPHNPATASSHMALWAKVMTDPHPQAALIGAQRVIRISGLAAYDKYEAAISEAQRAADTTKLSNSYSMAMTIWDRVEADNTK